MSANHHRPLRHLPAPAHSIGLPLLASTAFGASPSAAGEPIHVGDRLEPMVDTYLIDAFSGGAGLQLNRPQPQEIALRFTKPWEGNISYYFTVIPEDWGYRMYYRGADFSLLDKKVSHPEFICVAESRDGKTWTKPKLDIASFGAEKRTNIVWTGFPSHNLTPFKDQNPDCKPEARYKAVGGNFKVGLKAYHSADGLHWQLTQEEPIIFGPPFDSQNLAFWDPNVGKYVAYVREFYKRGKARVRGIMRATSDDFLHWTKPRWLNFGDAPHEHLYTNAVTHHPGAPHIYVGFPKRFMPERRPDHHDAPAVSDTVFMSSRDGKKWNRWFEALIPPGPQPSRWVNRNNHVAWGLISLPSDRTDAPDELNLFSAEGYYVGPCELRRYTLRQSGFVSVRAGGEPGEMVTKPLVFDKPSALVVNAATSAAGTIKFELQHASGRTIKGFKLADCDAFYGDTLSHTVTWQGEASLDKLKDKPVRLRAWLQDADLYSIQFVPKE